LAIYPITRIQIFFPDNFPTLPGLCTDTVATPVSLGTPPGDSLLFLLIARSTLSTGYPDGGGAGRGETPSCQRDYVKMIGEFNKRLSGYGRSYSHLLQLDHFQDIGPRHDSDQFVIIDHRDSSDILDGHHPQGIDDGCSGG